RGKGEGGRGKQQRREVGVGVGVGKWLVRQINGDAEGNGRPTTADYLRHLGMSSASLNEVGSRLYFVRRRFGGRLDTSAAENLTVTVARLLTGLVRSLRRKRERE
ncbi:MAG: four helix bundle protein, partial [Gemmatimonadaceae bacterium]